MFKAIGDPVRLRLCRDRLGATVCVCHLTGAGS
jgi:hypothetical protein